MNRRARMGELLSRMVPLSGHDVEEILEEQNSNRRKFGEIALSGDIGSCGVGRLNLRTPTAAGQAARRPLTSAQRAWSYATAYAHDTPYRTLFDPVGGFGVSSTDHLVPFHRSASVTVTWLPFT